MARRTALWMGLFLVLLVALLGVRQWRASHPTPEGSPTPTPLPRLFPAYFAEKAHALEVYRGEQRVARWTRSEDGKWNLVEGSAATSVDWNQAVSTLLHTRVSAVLQNQVPLETIGLAQPEWRFRVISTEGFYHLDIGHATPVGNGLYVRRIPRGEIFAIPAHVVEALLQPLSSGGTSLSPTAPPTPSPGK